MLHNEAYAGVAWLNRSVGGCERRTAQPREAWIAIPVPSIIPRERWQRVGAILTANRALLVGRPGTTPSLFRPYLRCACGGRMRPALTRAPRAGPGDEGAMEEEASFHGEFVNFDLAVSYPKPVQVPHPPILFGGATAQGRARVVDYCDGWIPIDVLLADLPAAIADLRRRAGAAGRRADELSVSVFAFRPPRG
jgi:alkanesulfonate monooxygenase SsuD/methylene tetrahydromethanopterin reductase-like flavin-dependent oxidoreductase (luciferase family)